MRGGAARAAGAGFGRGLPEGILQQIDYDPRRGRSSIVPKINEAIKLRAGILFSTGKIDEINFEDIVELFQALSVDGGEAVYFRFIDDFLEKCLDCSPVDLNAMHQHIAKGLGGIIYPMQLYQALQINSIRTILNQAHHHKVAKQGARQSTGGAQIERPFFVERVRWRVNRDDAFGTLPFTSLYLVVFMVLVVYHLQIWRRQELERGVEKVITSSAQKLYGPFIKEHVYSAGSFKDWLLKSGLKAFLGSVSGPTTEYHVRVAQTNVLIGDVQITQTWGDGYDESSVWLLGSSIGKAYLANNADDTDRFVRAAANSSDYYLSPQNEWVDDDTKEITLVFYLYDNQAEMYGKTDIWLRLDRLGFVVPVVKARGIIVFPYPFAWMYAVDAIYLLLILHTLYNECKDMCAAMALGFHSFCHYWSFWNTIDWITILLGFINIGLWILCCTSMQADILHSNLAEQDEKLVMKPNVVPWPSGDFESLQDGLAAIMRYFFMLNCSVASTAIFIVLKFFKGFEANPRLQTVTMTLKAVSVDIFHFSVVLIPVYLAFGLIGHTLFGQDVTKFYTLGNSLNTGITVLMGEFSWYTDLSDTPAIMPSGMPRFILALWFVIYMGFVLLIMINMLLAIVLEKYSEVYHILSQRSDARTLWQQTRRFIRRKAETRHFMPLYKIGHMLEDGIKPAHPRESVSHQSLKDAFPGMSDEQAEWLIQFLRTELREMIDHKNKMENFAVDSSLRVERMVQSVAEELHIVGATVEDCAERLSSMESVILFDSTWVTNAMTPRAPETLTSERSITIPSEIAAAGICQLHVARTKFGPMPGGPECRPPEHEETEEDFDDHETPRFHHPRGDATFLDCCY